MIQDRDFGEMLHVGHDQKGNDHTDCKTIVFFRNELLSHSSGDLPLWIEYFRDGMNGQSDVYVKP